MFLYASLYQHLQSIYHQLMADAPEQANSSQPSFALELPKESAHGDLATNMAMVCAKPLKQKPADLAQVLKPRIEEHPAVASVSIAGPGFLNINLKSTAWHTEVQQVVNNFTDFNHPLDMQQQKINVEFMSINPTGPVHVGHGRNAVLGDTLARVLGRLNYDVFREYLVNDAGNQIRTLVLSVHARYLEQLGQSAALPADGYTGDYIKDIAATLYAKDGTAWAAVTDEQALMQGLRSFCVNACMDMIKTDMATLDVHFDYFHSEHDMHQADDPVQQVISSLQQDGLAEIGTLPPPKGQEDTYVPEPLMLFKATKLGADADKAILDKQGNPTYFGQDMAYLRHKLKRGYAKQIVVVDIRQRSNFEPLKYAAQALTGEQGTIQPYYYALVKALRHGEPVKLSKRAGNIVSLGDVLAEVGTDAYRFHMLTRKADTELTFDLAKATEKSMDNPVFYVQYAHARGCSLFRQKAELQLPEATADDETVFASPRVQALMRQLMLYPQTLAGVGRTLEVHRLAFFAMDLAAAFHSWYNDEKILDANHPRQTHTRLQVVHAVQLVLADILQLLAVNAPERM